MTLENIKDEIRNDITNEVARINALRKINIKKKKDGTDFVQLSRAVENGNVIKNYINSDYEETYIEVICRGAQIYVEKIRCFGCVENLPKDDPRKPHNFRFRDTYQFTSEEIIKEIEATIEKAQRRIDIYKQKLETIDGDYREFSKLAIELHEKLENKDYPYSLTEAMINLVRFGY